MTFIVWTAVCKYDGVTPATDRVHSSQAKVLVVVSADSCDHCMMTRTASRHVTWRLQTSHQPSHETDATSHRITTSPRWRKLCCRNHNFTWHNSSQPSVPSGFCSPINNISDRLHSPRTSRCLRDRNTLIPQPRLRAEREAGHWPWAASHQGETMGMFLLKLTWVWLI